MNKIEKKISNFKMIWLYLFPIASYYFYSYVGINPTLGKGIYLILLPITVLLSLDGFFNFQSKRYAKFFLFILLLITLSMFNSYAFHEQNILLSYKVTAQYMAVAYFFYLLSIRPNIKKIEMLIWFLCIVYVVLWAYGMSKLPEIVFPRFSDEIIDDQRGVLRLRMAGDTITVLAFFMSINKYVVDKKKIWILVFSLLFIVILLHVTRQVIVLSFLLGVGHICYKTKWKWFFLIAVPFLYFFIGMVQFDKDSIVSKMINISDDQISNQKTGEEDIRIQEYKYFFFNYTDNPFTLLLGNGTSHSESNFGKKDMKLSNEFLFWDSDVGYAHIFIRFGLICLILYVIILYKGVKQKIDRKLVYAKLYIIYLILANIASTPILWEPVLLSIVFYLMEYDYQKQRYIKRNIICQ